VSDTEAPAQAGYIPLPGWYCPGCRGWNSLAKALESTPFKPKPCRFCDGPYTPETGLGRTELLRVVGLLARESDQLNEQLTRVMPSAEDVEVLRAAEDYDNYTGDSSAADLVGARKRLVKAVADRRRANAPPAPHPDSLVVARGEWSPSEKP
jgi:hypothetical protein